MSVAPRQTRSQSIPSSSKNPPGRRTEAKPPPKTGSTDQQSKLKPIGESKTVTMHASPASSNSSTSSRTNTTVTHTKPSSSSASSQHRTFKFHIKNIPQPIANQKTFYTTLVTHLQVKNIEVLKVNFNRTALLIVSEPLPDDFSKKLKTVTNSSDIEIGPINPPKMPHMNPTKKPTLFSVVIKSVDSDISENDIREELENLNLNFHQIWRIKSKKTDKFTSLIRVTSPNMSTIDVLLTRGITLFGRRHTCETSHASPPTPIQCTRCFQRGHESSNCPNRPICPNCPNQHSPNKCPQADPKCPFCQGNHPAWSRKCPKYHEFAISDDTPTLPVLIIDPPEEFADPTDPTDEPTPIDSSIVHPRQLIAFLTKTLMDLLPHNRQVVKTTIEKPSVAIFRLHTRINPSGERLHFTFDE